MPNVKPSAAHNAADRPRRDAITAVSGANEASTISEVAIISASGS